MALDTTQFEGGLLIDYVDAALKGLKDDLEEGDLALVGVVRKAAMAHDQAEADGKMLSAMNYLSYVTNGIEKLGGSALARKTLGKKADKPKRGLAAVRELRSAPSAQAADGTTPTKPRAPRKPRNPKAE